MSIAFDAILTIPATLTTNLYDSFSRVTKPTPKLKDQDHEDDILRKCTLRLDTGNPLTHTIPTQSGHSRTLSYAQFGSPSPTAKTIFFLHGWPGSRIEGTWLDAPALAQNIRIIAVDRPGTGLSTPDEHRTILSHATEDISQLAAHLGAETYGVLGVSGGGPYALACAKALAPTQLKAVGIVCGLGPSEIGYRGMFLPNYLGWTYATHITSNFVAWNFSREPQFRLDLPVSERLSMMRKAYESSATPRLWGWNKMPAKDVEIFDNEDVRMVQVCTAREVMRQGGGSMRWMMQDMKLLASDLGFDVRDVRKDLQVRMWYGREDGNVPLQHGIQVARRLRTVEERMAVQDGEGNGKDGEGIGGERVCLKIVDGETHASIFFDFREEVLREMGKAMDL